MTYLARFHGGSVDGRVEEIEDAPLVLLVHVQASLSWSVDLPDPEESVAVSYRTVRYRLAGHARPRPGGVAHYIFDKA